MVAIHGLLDWLKAGVNAGTLITILTIAGGFAVSHGRDQERMANIETRISLVETGAVRHGEYDANDKALTQIMQSIDARLSNIERVLMERK